jgi:hypothetical protein
MKIDAARVIVTSPGRNVVTLKISTDQGVSGTGHAPLTGRERPVVSYLEDQVRPCLIGRDPRQIEDIWQMRREAREWRRHRGDRGRVRSIHRPKRDSRASGIPGVTMAYGVGRRGDYYEPAHEAPRRNLPRRVEVPALRAAAKCPRKPASLPVARLTDGTMWNR